MKSTLILFAELILAEQKKREIGKKHINLIVFIVVVFYTNDE